MNGGSNHLQGRVEVYILGRWGRVCGSNWGLREATVACHQLGYSTALNVSIGAEFGQGAQGSVIWLNQLQCTGYEANLTQCVNGDRLLHSSCSHGDAGITCAGVINNLQMSCRIDNTLHSLSCQKFHI